MSDTCHQHATALDRRSEAVNVREYLVSALSELERLERESAGTRPADWPRKVETQRALAENPRSEVIQSRAIR